MRGAGSSCGACKFLRRKCTSECVFTPYFCYSQGADHFAAVHKIFGASNVFKLLMKIPIQNRSEAAISISYEALARMHDPIYGCVAQIFALEQQVASLQEEIDQLVNNICYDSSFGRLPNHGSLHEINNTNNGLPFSLQYEDTSNSDQDLNQQAPTLFVETQNSCFFGQNIYDNNFLDHPVTDDDCKILNT